MLSVRLFRPKAGLELFVEIESPTDLSMSNQWENMDLIGAMSLPMAPFPGMQINVLQGGTCRNHVVVNVILSLHVDDHNMTYDVIMVEK